MNTRKYSLLLWLGTLAFALGCSPTPSAQDAASNAHDGAGTDHAIADAGPRDLALATDRNAPVDTLSADQEPSDSTLPDNPIQDSALSDSQQSDTAVPDTAVSDTTLPDTAPQDAYVFFGPYVASGLPRIILDADANGAVLTQVLIPVPASLNVDFVDVHVEIRHQDSRDLVVTFLPPLGSGATLYNGNDCTQNCDTGLSIDQRVPVYDSTQGNWVLNISDRFQSHTGTLLSFTVSFVP